MTSHRPPPPARTPRVVWVIAFGAVVGIVGPPVVALAQTVAPQVAAQTALAWPEQTPEPMGHGGLGGAVALPSVGVLPPGASMPMGVAEPPPRVTSDNPVSAPRTPAPPRSGLSGGLTRASNAPTGLSEASTASPSETVAPPPAAETTAAATESPATTTPDPTETIVTTTQSPTETTTTTDSLRHRRDHSGAVG